jgi:uncharacterized membrane protein
MAQVSSFRDIQITSSEIGIRKIGVQDLFQSLKEGYDDFNAMPSFGVFLAVIYPLAALLLTLWLVGGQPLYLAFPMIAGLALIGPVVSVALFEMSRRREMGLDLGWRPAFDFIHSASFAPIVALSVIMAVLYAGWIFMAQFIYVGRFGIDPPASIPEFMTQLFTTQRGAALIIYGNLIGFLFAFTTLAISVVGFPLLLDRPATSLTAISTSVRAVTANGFVMALWGVIVAVLLAVGAMLFLIGLAVVLPILGHATWHLYRKVVEP